jgi:hypothetical protein
VAKDFALPIGTARVHRRCACDSRDPSGHIDMSDSVKITI